MIVCACARKHARKRWFCLFLLIAVTYMALLFSGCRSKPSTDQGLVIKESKTGQYDEIEVAPGFLLLSNMWATEEKTDQKIYLYDDGSYGWQWQRGDSGENNPNYPKVVYGVTPWGQGVHDKTLLLPKQLKEIDTLLMELDFDYEVTNKAGWWSVTVEFFLTTEQPGPGEDITVSIQDEVMIYFDWQDETYSPLIPSAVVDGSYTYDLTKQMDLDDWYYSQFRIGEKGRVPKEVNLKRFLDYIKEEYNRSDDLWLSAVELGIMYNDQTAGQGLVKKLDYVINGERVSSGRP